jgi:NAD+ synthase (glutamine-hydrolysing)
MATVEELFNTLCGGLRRFMASARKKDVVLGLSGGVDSAVVACIAAKALGPEHVKALVMPSPFSSRDSETDAFKLAVALDIHTKSVPIGGSPHYPSALATFETLLHDAGYKVEGVTLENLQARIRAVLLMAHANEHDALVLNTGNLSEALMGYCTLYGDSIGAVAPIGNVLKMDVYHLALYINARGDGEVIPRNIIEKPPSAELRLGQQDSDDLPPYDVLDPILRRYVEGMLALNFTDMTAKEQDIVTRIEATQFKRDQSPPALAAPRCIE